jgi:hypothetical protein
LNRDDNDDEGDEPPTPPPPPPPPPPWRKKEEGDKAGVGLGYIHDPEGPCVCAFLKVMAGTMVMVRCKPPLFLPPLNGLTSGYHDQGPGPRVPSDGTSLALEHRDVNQPTSGAPAGP